MKTSQANETTNDSGVSAADERATNWLLAALAMAIAAMLLWGSVS